ncbi:F-box protein At1g11270-like [Arabidopsis lyrata subsp. lyrata]|uniref:F-box protein At1g11270-like n=1 Tax=Arabidopsis lyrata subsp. lyrata TaxID=81972 RepID=UPI000A29C24E|nr:F-box protein At1g11270-like [Arabidopsis lyrata subsp. lyrata]|eukprot:XP_020867242.1 F-box protein At1g11270-like [Arabidopsis lyrata subsp. lyrata]
MLKRHRSSSSSSFVLKRHRSSVQVQLLPYDVVELILERLPGKSLLRFKCLSKNWKRQLIRRKQLRGPDVLFVSLEDDEAPRSIVFGSSIVSTVKFPTSCSIVCYGSCDGLVCLYCVSTPGFVISPATRWHQSFPLSSFQQLRMDRLNKGDFRAPNHKLGFGKDKVRGIYKPVWLYNSSEYGLDNVTTCEVFDFSTNAWRYLVPASPLRVLVYHKPVYLDGSLYWFTACEEETKILSLDLHTETFQVISKTPFPHVSNPLDVNMCILDNRLCVSEKKWPIQVIWLFDSSGTWKQMCSIDLTKTFSWFGEPKCVLFPIAILDKNKLLLHAREDFQPVEKQPVVIHDLRTKSYDFVFRPTTFGFSIYYFQSLFSVLPI